MEDLRVAKPTNNPKLKLLGFNNLTKTLSFNIYDICYARTQQHQQEYIEYIDEQYNAERLTEILTEVADIIGANILNVARQDYDPQGASVTMLISEGHLDGLPTPGSPEPGTIIQKDSVVTHLDKSHITVHTYPENHPDAGISTFRADIDVSTCGKISPLKALNYLIKSFESDIVVMDYRVRGFTRNVRGMKHFIDHNVDSIQNFISKSIRERYDMVDVNVYQENIFHTKMKLKELDLDTYLFGEGAAELPPRDAKRISERVDHEIMEIFYGRNIQR
ncbi:MULTISPECIES: adenosylmethionine decarboxylase [Hydrocarboniphaga]|uniref:S-adenosylmethionine decarboxylase proenzyme n=1 Tax=Hydrocarboniphaga effusa AP103 TaxID=1172194 RepID=I8I5Q3_9GAMM|nr:MULTISPECIES: adenosylmethionine decarboxylase [Hydrocarboniphaga]EIT71866.1 S-adenosylmethionine decarboxylase proenzyme [Hydrocarboniphaga effusa AP103]MDZ4077433.1 adenosylmethionine decarboxylase [Hydrocarboniphaga sp.]